MAGKFGSERVTVEQRNSMMKLPRCLRIAKPVVEWRRETSRKLEHPPHIVSAFCTHGAIKEQLTQDVMLGVAATHPLCIG